MSALAANPGSVCFALMFGPIDDHQPAVKLALQRPNLNVLAMDGGVLRGKIAEWPQDVFFRLGDFHEFGRFLVSEVMGEAEARNA